MAWSVQTCRRISLSLGYFCIFVFFSLTIYMVYVFYATIAPSVLQRGEYKRFVFHFIFGNWIVINIYFNYIMAWLSSPGLAKDYQSLATQYPKCKKCSMNKPPRTHHCSWCDACILKFDHHCPWLNNCVGFYNHRYFVQFSSFMAIGCIYTGIVAYREYQISLLGEQTFYYKDSFFKPFEILEIMGTTGFITYYIFIAGFTCGILIIGLLCWHGRMIGRGETSLERILNVYYTKQCYMQGFIFVNPYDFGFIENWKRFFGVRTMGEFIRRVLLPSTHRPEGDGITWDGYNVNTNLELHQQQSQQTTQPIAFSPGIHPKFPGARPTNGYRFLAPPWEKRNKPAHISTLYQPKTPPIETVDSRKNR